MNGFWAGCGRIIARFFVSWSVMASHNTNRFFFWSGLAAGGFLGVTGTLLYLFFGNYSGDRLPHPALWRWGGLLLALTGVGLFAYTVRRASVRARRKREKAVGRLRETGTPVWVDLKRCEIVSSSVEEDKVRDSVDTCSRLKYIHAAKAYYSDPIYRDEDAIRLKLELQKQTALYLSGSGDDYYFDIEFFDE